MAYEEVYIEFWSSQRKKKRIEAQDKMDRLVSNRSKEKKVKKKK